MMKNVFIIITLSLLIAGTASALMIKVDVSEVLKTETVAYNANSSGNLVKILPEFYNTGSVGYAGRARLDIINGSSVLLTTWSSGSEMKPGDRKVFRMFWYADKAGNYTARLRFYFANEIMEQELKIQVNKSITSEDAFEISDFRTYDDRVTFNVAAKKDATAAVAIPIKYTAGWMFEPAVIGNMNAGETEKVALSYDPGTWAPGKLKLAVVSNDGEFYTEKDFEMKKSADVLQTIRQALCMIKICI
jgi:hypothetical protein